MTVKELADFTGKNVTTVTRWIKKAQMHNADTQMQYALVKGHEKDFSVDEIEFILQHSSMSKDAISILMENARHDKVPTDSTQFVTKRELTSILSELTIAITSAITKAMPEIITQTVKSLKDEHLVDNKSERGLFPAPEMAPRAHINMLVRDYATKNSMEYRDVWRELYRQFGYRTNTNPGISAKNRGMNIIDYIDSEGQLETLEAVAVDVFSEEIT